MQFYEGCNWTSNEEIEEVKFYMKDQSDRVGEGEGVYTYRCEETSLHKSCQLHKFYQAYKSY